MKWMILILFAVGCATATPSPQPPPVSKVIVVEPAIESCDIADTCCYVDGVKWCCFDNGKSIRCWKGYPIDLTYRGE